MLRIDCRTDILAVIDVQPTFMPGGELPVPAGDKVLSPINHLLEHRFKTAFATQDWHPPGHSSFASSHSDRAGNEVAQMPYGPQTLWPDHAIQGSSNAALHPMLLQDRLQMILRKGSDVAVDSYSAFRENNRTTSTGLAGWLRDRGCRRLFLCGLATDFCVGWSAQDAVASKFETFVIEDACRGIGVIGADGLDSVDAMRRDLRQRGVTFLNTTDLV